MSLSNIRENRLKKLKRLKDLRINPYPSKSKRTHLIKKACRDFKKLARKKEEIILAGRIYSIREHGGSTFIHFGDETGKIQAYFRKDVLGQKAYKFFLNNFDIGDFIEVKGFLFKTKRGEKTIQVSDFRMLTKSLLPLPEKWHGLKDVEERYRKRYLDLIFNPEVKKRFEKRSQIIREIRRFLEKNGFLEVETPILQPIYGGAKAQPFKTHLNALDIDLYLRISLELYLKRLIVGGFGKIYEIGKCFRNEGIDRFHNPDFTMLEFYWAYIDYKELMKFTEEMFKTIVKKVKKSLKIKYQNKVIDFTPPWPRIEFSHLLRKKTKINIDEIHIEALKKEAEKLGIKIEKGEGKAEIADKIYKKVCRNDIINPTFVIHHPIGAFPLAKQLESNPKKLANFQVIVGGWELVNAFSELNDPIEQRKRFEEQEKMYKQGFKEAQRMDEDFIEALEYGMPPCAGFGMGIDRLVALLTDAYSLREIILFPTMRPKK
ncbi:lysine--tRNA ligase [bacterium]|nr:lysine--tRNA ligase [bacterium]